MITSYRRLLTQAGAPRLLLVSLIAKLSTPVLSLALLLAAVDRTGSYATAGLVLTGHALALAAFSPLGGRLADRHGLRATLAGYLAAHAIAYGALLLSLQAQATLAIGAAALLGATAPPVGAVIRTTWSRLVPAEVLPTAYAADNAVNELMFIAGPMLVPLLTVVMPAGAIVGAAGAALLFGTALLLTFAVVREAPPALPLRPPTGQRIRRVAGPLTHRRSLALLAIAAFGTFTFGCLRIATVASATTHGSASVAGLLMGLLSAGALAGTLLYGARAWPVSSRRILIAMTAAEAALLATAAATSGPAILAALIMAIGLVTGPRDAVLPVLLADTTPARYRTEVFAWLTTFTWVGYGVGTTVAGRLTLPHDGGTTAFGVAAVATLLAAVAVTLTIRLRQPGAIPRAPIHAESHQQQ